MRLLSQIITTLVTVDNRTPLFAKFGGVGVCYPDI